MSWSQLTQLKRATCSTLPYTSKLWLSLGNLTRVEGRVSHCESLHLPLFSITLGAGY